MERRKRNKIMITICLVISGLFFAHTVIASTSYTTADVAQHSTTKSCWTVYNGGVYDITTYLVFHNQNYYNITSWCGTDMTSNFDAIGKHRGKATTLLETFKIGILGTSANATTTAPDTTTTSTTTTEEDTTTTTVTTDTTTNTPITSSLKIENPYNLLLPLILGIVLYWGSLFIFRKNLRRFNGFWNTILILTFLIPSFGFGIFMILQYQFPSLMNLTFRFTYWHVEFSVFMSVLAISHFIRRVRIYFMQIKSHGR